jgi:hypothetical protein
MDADDGDARSSEEEMITDKDTTTIDQDTLREWLDAHKPVTVLDIRTDDNYAIT